MNLLGILTGWTGGQRFGISEQFARVGFELSGNTGWFALAPAAQILPRGGRPRHATGHLADATDELSRRPSQLSRRPDGLAGLTDESAGLTVHPAGPPDGLAGRPGRLSRRPGESDGRPSEPDGPGAVRREGMDGARRPGAARRGGADFVPEGRWAVATGGAQGRRPERNPWTGAERCISAPAGRRSFAGCASAAVDAPFLCPSGTEEHMNDALHGLRSLEDSLTPPVATPLGPVGAGRRGDARRVFDAARAIGARGGAGGVHVRRGEVPEASPAARPCGISGAGGSDTGVRDVE